MRALSTSKLVAHAAAVTFLACTGAPSDPAPSDSAELFSPSSFALDMSAPGRLHLGNAYWMARLNEIVRESPEAALAQLRAIGIDSTDVIFFESVARGAFAMYVGTPQVGILTFRNNEPSDRRDWQTSFNKAPAETSLGPVHTGYLLATMAIWEDQDGVTAHVLDSSQRWQHAGGKGIVGVLRQRHPKEDGVAKVPLLLNGHSMGGGMATIAASLATWDSCRSQHPAEIEPDFWLGQGGGGAIPDCVDQGIGVNALYTYGTPRMAQTRFHTLTGYKQNPDFRAGVALFRFVNEDDTVPAVVFFGKGYEHPTVSDSVVYLTKNGQIDVGGRSTAYRDERALPLSFAAHGIDRYRDKLLGFAQRAPEQAELSEWHRQRYALQAAYSAPIPPILVPLPVEEMSYGERRLFTRDQPEGSTREGFRWRHDQRDYLVLQDTYAGSTGGRWRTVDGKPEFVAHVDVRICLDGAVLVVGRGFADGVTFWEPLPPG